MSTLSENILKTLINIKNIDPKDTALELEYKYTVLLDTAIKQQERIIKLENERELLKNDVATNYILRQENRVQREKIAYLKSLVKSDIE